MVFKWTSGPYRQVPAANTRFDRRQKDKHCLRPYNTHTLTSNLLNWIGSDGENANVCRLRTTSIYTGCEWSWSPERVRHRTARGPTDEMNVLYRRREKFQENSLMLKGVFVLALFSLLSWLPILSVGISETGWLAVQRARSMCCAFYF